MTARAVPFGESIVHNGRPVQFDAGSITVPETLVPLTVDHGSASSERIGKLTRWFEDSGAGYAEFDVSETALGSDVLTLLHDGVLTDVSIGVEVDEDAEFEDDAGVLHRTGVLDHVSIVGKGAFGNAGSKVLAVHSEEGAEMAETEAAAPTVVTYDDTEMRNEIIRLTEKIDSYENKVVKEQDLFPNMKDYILTLSAAASGKQDAIEKMTKSDRYEREIGTYAYDSADSTTTAAGLVPSVLSQRIIGLLEGSRPGVDAFPKIDPGPVGMSVVMPAVTTKPTVAAHTEQAAMNTTEAVIATQTYTMVPYAGANRVSIPLLERSSPAFADRLFAELASSYATVTDAAFVAALVAGVGTNTAILADMSADPTATYAAVLAGIGAIAADIKRPADTMILGSAPWLELLSNLDSEDRPLVAAYAPHNAEGVGSGNFWSFDYALGLRTILDPHAAAQTTLIAWSGAASSIEAGLPRLTAQAVAVGAVDLGIMGLFVPALHYAGNVGGLYSLTAA